MTFKKDFNELLLHLRRILVKDALHSEESVSALSRDYNSNIKENKHKQGELNILLQAVLVRDLSNKYSPSLVAMSTHRCRTW